MKPEPIKVISINSLKEKTKSKKLLTEIQELIEYAAEDDYRNLSHIIGEKPNCSYPELDKYLLSKGLSITEQVILNLD